MAKDSSQRWAPEPLDETKIARHIAKPQTRHGFNLKRLSRSHGELSKKILKSLKEGDPKGGKSEVYLADGLERLTISMNHIIHWCNQEPARLAIALAGLASATAFLEHAIHRNHRPAVRNPSYPVALSWKRRAKPRAIAAEPLGKAGKRGAAKSR